MTSKVRKLAQTNLTFFSPSKSESEQIKFQNIQIEIWKEQKVVFSNISLGFRRVGF